MKTKPVDPCLCGAYDHKNGSCFDRPDTHTPTPWATYGWKHSDKFGIQHDPFTGDNKSGCVLPDGDHGMSLEDANYVVRAVNAYDEMYSLLLALTRESEATPNKYAVLVSYELIKNARQTLAKAEGL